MASVQPANLDNSNRPVSHIVAHDTWVDAYADALYAYAILRVRRPEVAEDLVQETFLAAWKSRHRFRGQSSEQTWLTAILKNKIMDHYRRLAREVPCDSSPKLASFEEGLFHSSGYSKDVWRQSAAPQPWPENPEHHFERREFWQAFHACMNKLPDGMAQAFVQRELEAATTADICQTMNITANNLAVLLHRARLALRQCLEKSWFAPGGRPGHPPSSIHD